MNLFSLNELNLYSGGMDMFCRRCKVKMKEQSHSAHKKRKFLCPLCGGARMMGGKEKVRDRRRKEQDL